MVLLAAMVWWMTLGHPHQEEHKTTTQWMWMQMQFELKVIDVSDINEQEEIINEAEEFHENWKDQKQEKRYRDQASFSPMPKEDWRIVSRIERLQACQEADAEGIASQGRQANKAEGICPAIATRDGRFQGE